MTGKIKRAAAKYLLRSGRGGGLMSQLTDLPRDFLDGSVYILAINGVFNMGIGVNESAKIIFGFVIAKKIGEYILGHIDEHLGFWKYENEYLSREMNPFNRELLNKINNSSTHKEFKDDVTILTIKIKGD